MSQLELNPVTGERAVPRADGTFEPGTIHILASGPNAGEGQNNVRMWVQRSDGSYGQIAPLPILGRLEVDESNNISWQQQQDLIAGWQRDGIISPNGDGTMRLTSEDQWRVMGPRTPQATPLPAELGEFLNSRASNAVQPPALGMTSPTPPTGVDGQATGPELTGAELAQFRSELRNQPIDPARVAAMRPEMQAIVNPTPEMQAVFEQAKHAMGAMANTMPSFSVSDNGAPIQTPSMGQGQDRER